MNTATSRLSLRTALLIVASLLLGILAACGGSGGSNTTPTPTPTPTVSNEFLYVGTAAGGIAALSVSPTSGALTAVTGSPFSVGSGSVRLAADPSGKFVYSSSAAVSATDLQVLSVNSSTGALASVATFGTSTIPGAIAVDPGGKNAYMVSDPTVTPPTLTAFSINAATHALSALPNQPSGVAGPPHSIVVDPSGKFVYITLTGMPGDEIAGRLRDPNTGDVTVLPGSPFGNVGGDVPQGIVVTPGGNFVIAANSVTNNVSVLALTPSSGMLNNIGGSPFTAGTNPFGVAIDPSGKFVFVTNQGSNNMSVYSMNASSGGLTQIAGSPFTTGAGPHGVTVDPSGGFVYVANTDGTISAFSLNTGTGALTPIAGSPFMVAVGTALRDVVVVRP